MTEPRCACWPGRRFIWVVILRPCCLFERIGNRSMMADDLYLLGVALSRTGNDKGSAEEWTQGLRADPDHPQILHGMIKVNLKMDRFFEAAAEARRLAKQRPFHSGSSRAFHFRNSRQDNHWLNVKLSAPGPTVLPSG
ncbi:MAG: hypothetical protein WA746_29620 [Isosphaeraceae bacterium]